MAYNNGYIHLYIPRWDLVNQDWAHLGDSAECCWAHICICRVSGGCALGLSRPGLFEAPQLRQLDITALFSSVGISELSQVEQKCRSKQAKMFKDSWGQGLELARIIFWPK